MCSDGGSEGPRGWGYWGPSLQLGYTGWEPDGGHLTPTSVSFPLSHSASLLIELREHLIPRAFQRRVCAWLGCGLCRGPVTHAAAHSPPGRLPGPPGTSCRQRWSAA